MSQKDRWTMTLFEGGGIRKTSAGTNVHFETIVAKIRSTAYVNAVARVRAATTDAARNEAKAKLDYFLPAGIFAERKLSGLQEYSGVICIDIDHVPSADLPGLRARLCADDFLLCLFVSPSGNGLKLFFATDAESPFHKTAFAQVVFYLEKNYEVDKVAKIDRSVKDVSRACYVSADPDLYYNPDAETFQIDLLNPVFLPVEKKKYVHRETTTTGTTKEELREYPSIIISFRELSDLWDSLDSNFQKGGAPIADDDGDRITMLFALRNLCADRPADARAMWLRFFTWHRRWTQDRHADAEDRYDRNALTELRPNGAGLGAILRILKSFNIYAIQGDVPNLDVTIIDMRGKGKVYISTLVDQILSFIKDKDAVCIVAPAGAGKTVACLELAQRFVNEDGVRVMAVPRAIIGAQMEAEYGDKYGVAYVGGNISAMDFVASANARVCSTNFTAFEIFFQEIKEIPLFLVDEAHELANGYSEDFMKTQIDTLLEAMSHARKKVWVTATPNLVHLRFAKIPVLQILTDPQQRFPFYTCIHKTYSDSGHQIVAAALAARGAGQKIVVFLNDLARCHQLCAAVVAAGVDCVQIDSTKKGEIDFETIATQQTLTATVTICTSVLQLGANILNEDLAGVYIVDGQGGTSATEIIQYANRFRRQQTLPIYWCVSRYRAARPPTTNESEILQMIYFRAQAIQRRAEVWQDWAGGDAVQYLACDDRLMIDKDSEINPAGVGHVYYNYARRALSVAQIKEQLFQQDNRFFDAENQQVVAREKWDGPNGDLWEEAVGLLQKYLREVAWFSFKILKKPHKEIATYWPNRHAPPPDFETLHEDLARCNGKLSTGNLYSLLKRYETIKAFEKDEERVFKMLVAAESKDAFGKLCSFFGFLKFKNGEKAVSPAEAARLEGGRWIIDTCGDEFFAREEYDRLRALDGTPAGSLRGYSIHTFIDLLKTCTLCETKRTSSRKKGNDFFFRIKKKWENAICASAILAETPVEDRAGNTDLEDAMAVVYGDEGVPF